MNRFLFAAALAALIVGPVYAQDISGDWQGTLKAGPQQLRIILHIAKAGNGWSGELYSIDQGPDAIPISSLTLQNANVKFAVDLVHGSYDGKVSADGTSIAGAWTQGRPMPLDFQRATKGTAWKRDTSPHSVQFVTVEQNVRLEVLDWGGTGRPVVLLAGLGNTAHIFDKFAPKLTSKHHVYGITRRGFGASSSPAPDGNNYSADRLGDDVLAVCHALKLQKPVQIGHSIAGEELSSIGSRQPDEVVGLVYLDAGYAYAYYDRSRGDFLIDLRDLQNKLEALQPGHGSKVQEELIGQLLQTDLPRFENDLREQKKNLEALPSPPELPAIPGAILMGGRKIHRYTRPRSGDFCGAAQFSAGF